MRDEERLLRLLERPRVKQRIRHLDPTSGALIVPGVRGEPGRDGQGLMLPRLAEAPPNAQDGEAWQEVQPDGRYHTIYQDDGKPHTLQSAIKIAVWNDTTLYSGGQEEDLYDRLAGERMLAQGFTALYSDEVGSIRVYMRRVDSFKPLRCRLYSDSGGVPNSLLGTCGSLDYAEVGTSMGWVRFVFASPIAVTASTVYHIVLDVQGDDIGTYEYQVAYDDGAGYSGGAPSYSTGGGWTPIAGEDFIFEVWSPTAALGGGGSAGSNDKASVSSNDTTPGFLSDKLDDGDGIGWTEVSDGADESYRPDLYYSGQTRGDMIVRGAASWMRKPVGSAGDVWQSDGTDPGWGSVPPHASRHQNGGADEVATATPGANEIPKANGSGKLGSGWGGAASSLATLDGSSKVVQDPANATATPTASKIPIADTGGRVNAWVRQSKDFSIEYPGASENRFLRYFPRAATIKLVAEAVVDDGGGSPSVDWNIYFASARNGGSPTQVWTSDRTVTSEAGTTTTTFDNAAISAGSWVWFVTSASADCAEIDITIEWEEAPAT